MTKFYFALLAMLTATMVQAADLTKKGEIATDEAWTAENVYFLDGFVHVMSGATLSIEPGTVIKGLSQGNITSGDFTSALIITKGGMIDAQGTADMPIIFTSELDDITLTNDLDLSDGSQSRGLWGGLILLGKAPIGDESSSAVIEGMADETKNEYGGTIEDDNSGILKYVSIRHGGAEIVTDEEINGLSLGAVGSGTTIEHIEVLYNKDDGIEFFGGSVSIKWAFVGFCGDDAFDWDLGWRGNGQFWVALGGQDAGDHGGEWDGCKPDDNARNSMPTIYNFTFIGGYDGSVSDAKNEHAILMRDGTAGIIANGIIAGFNNYALQIEETDKSKHSFGYMNDGDLVIKNNIWHDFGAGSTLDDIILATPDKASAGHLEAVKTHLTENNNEVAASGLDVSTRPMNLIPAATDLAGTKAAAARPANDWFSDADYIGAYEPGTSEDWSSWTVAAQYGVSANQVVGITKTNGNIIQANVFPNPADESTKLVFTLLKEDLITMKILDLNGRVVKNINANNFQTGLNSQELNVSDLKTGVYFITMKSNTSFFTQRLIVE